MYVNYVCQNKSEKYIISFYLCFFILIYILTHSDLLKLTKITDQSKVISDETLLIQLSIANEEWTFHIADGRLIIEEKEL